MYRNDAPWFLMSKTVFENFIKTYLYEMYFDCSWRSFRWSTIRFDSNDSATFPTNIFLYIRNGNAVSLSIIWFTWASNASLLMTKQQWKIRANPDLSLITNAIWTLSLCYKSIMTHLLWSSYHNTINTRMAIFLFIFNRFIWTRHINVH